MPNSVDWGLNFGKSKWLTMIKLWAISNDKPTYCATNIAEFIAPFKTKSKGTKAPYYNSSVCLSVCLSLALSIYKYIYIYIYLYIYI